MLMEPGQSRFYFTVCQAGAEPALKKEVLRDHRGLRFAFSRPGFVTFKIASETEQADAGFRLGAVFARAYGVSLGKLGANEGDAASKARALAGLAAKLGPRPLRLHVWERDLHVPGEEPPSYVRGAVAGPIEKLLRQAAPGLFHEETRAEAGDAVFDVVAVEENEWWAGWHLHSAEHSPFPGGRAPLVLPPESPSRAWLKLEEGILWSGAPLRAGQTAVEIGSAPGGASYALLQRGLKVIGIDPAEMDPRVRKHPAFTHIRRDVRVVRREDLPASVEWVLLDMNVPPHVSLALVENVAVRCKDSLLGLLLTIKLNEWSLADEIPAMLEKIKSIGLARVRATQLPSNKQEIFVFAQSRKAVIRA